MSLRGSLRIAQHLLGRDVGPGADRPVELLGDEVGKLVVARQAEIDQHRLAVVAQDDVARLEVEMDDVLADGCRAARHATLAPMRATSSAGSGVLSSSVLSELSGDELHHDVGLLEIAGRDEARHVRAGEPRQDHLLDSRSRRW